MRIRNVGRHGEGVELMMTPMVDIVFQLLIFFLMTFKITSAEGDFNVKMPLAAPSQGKPDELQLPPLKVRLTADPGGRIAGIFLGQAPMKDFRQLREQIVGIVGDDTGPGSITDTQEVELDCDYNLDFKHVIDAITAVSGQITPDGEVVKLIEKIKFAPPRGS
ncbi:MAG: biopolymer transporter ExbD [Planctomycetia bacterium]|jgi:biopolymer transport protein ExbD|nr:biopolymer transporter ExbD [Planctomycetia bacterium]